MDTKLTLDLCLNWLKNFISMLIQLFESSEWLQEWMKIQILLWYKSFQWELEWSWLMPKLIPNGCCIRSFLGEWFYGKLSPAHLNSWWDYCFIVISLYLWTHALLKWIDDHLLLTPFKLRRAKHPSMVTSITTCMCPKKAYICGVQETKLISF